MNDILVFRKFILKRAWLISQDPRLIYKSANKAGALLPLTPSPGDEAAHVAGYGPVVAEAFTKSEAY